MWYSERQIDKMGEKGSKSDQNLNYSPSLSEKESFCYEERLVANSWGILAKRFINPHQKKILRAPLHYLLWQLGFYKDQATPSPLPDQFSFPAPKSEYLESNDHVRWVNHSTFLIQSAGLSFITDPIFSERCSPFSFFGPRRQHAATPSADQLPDIDFVIISHNHYDHLDRQSVQFLMDRFPNINWIVPFGVKKWFISRIKGIDSTKVHELHWHESMQCEHKGKQVTFTATPAQHYSGRGLFDKNKTLWMGCVVQTCTKKSFYFAGDTGYNDVDFKEVGNRFEKIDLSLLPIGVYLPRPFMRPVHVDPYESVLMHQDIGSCLSIGGHWKTFCLSNEEPGRPPFDLLQALQEKGICPSKFCVLPPGSPINW